MSIKARAVIRREVMFDSKKPRGKHYYAALQLFSEDGDEHGVTRYFSGGFSQVAAFLQSEAEVPHEQLQYRYPRAGPLWRRKRQKLRGIWHFAV
jgi:hypothetical protein